MMVKDTCLILTKEKIRVLIYLILKSHERSPWSEITYHGAHKYTIKNAKNMYHECIKFKRGCDFGNLDAKITGIRVTVEKIWTFEAMKPKLEFWKVTEVYLEIQKFGRPSV
jgi:hypothetical protein